MKCEQLKQNLEMIPNEKDNIMKLEEMKQDIMNKFKEEEGVINKDSKIQENIAIGNKGIEESTVNLTQNSEENTSKNNNLNEIEMNSPVTSLLNINLSNVNTNILGLTEEIVDDKVSIYNNDTIKVNNLQ